MSPIKYLIVGSSHAALSAFKAIRSLDEKGSVTLLTQEKYLPYSPTILPYVVSGEVDPGKIFLRDEADLERDGITLKRRAKVVDVDPSSRMVSLNSGEGLKYENLLLATGAEPMLPPIPGLKAAPFHVLRTLEDALHLRKTAMEAKSAIVLGTGLIGMHAAENLAKNGLEVTMVEALPQVLPGYFDDQAANLIHKVFTEQGIRILIRSEVTHVAVSNGACAISLGSGVDLSSDLLVVATGIKPRMAYLGKSGIEAEEGILVDKTMKTSESHIWAAGDVAQVRDFFGTQKVVHGTLPASVEQGKMAGLDMVGDPALKPYPGSISMNTYKFFGHRSFTIGSTNGPNNGSDMEVDRVFLPTSLKYQKLIYQDDRLVGASCINTDLDPGILYQIIRRRVNLSDVKKRFASDPLKMGRLLMSRIWS